MSGVPGNDFHRGRGARGGVFVRQSAHFARKSPGLLLTPGGHQHAAHSVQTQQPGQNGAGRAPRSQNQRGGKFAALIQRLKEALYVRVVAHQFVAVPVQGIHRAHGPGQGRGPVHQRQHLFFVGDGHAGSGHGQQPRRRHEVGQALRRDAPGQQHGRNAPGLESRIVQNRAQAVPDRISDDPVQFLREEHTGSFGGLRLPQPPAGSGAAPRFNLSGAE